MENSKFDKMLEDVKNIKTSELVKELNSTLGPRWYEDYQYYGFEEYFKRSMDLMINKKADYSAACLIEFSTR